MEKLFVDTGGWMAMADVKDPVHVTSAKARDHWLEQGGVLATSNYVLDETLTLIRIRLGIEPTEKWWTMISESPRCHVEWVSPERVAKAIRWFFKWKDQSFSFTDCTSFIIMRELGIEKVLTGDRHFNTAGFQILP